MRLSAMLVLSLVAACASVPRPPELSEQRWIERRQVLSDLDRWTLNGRLALQQEQEAWHASIYWQQQGQTFDIRLISPLGSGVVFIEGDSSGVLLRLPEGKTLTAPDAEYLLYEQVGWRMPLAGLHYWVRGLPQPDAPFTKALDEQGRLVSLHQAGWDIRFPSYVRVAGVDLPRKVFLENHPLSVRLVIQSWDRG